LAFAVNLTKTALRDAQEYLEYLNGRSNFDETGYRWWSRLFEALDTLQEMPERCTHYPHTIRGNAELRYLLFGSHRIVFSLDTALSQVIVLRLIHTARRPH
jgi:plasmid stabilization system protein ParE